MRTVLFLSFMLAASIAGAQNKLTVVVDGIEKSEGKIFVAVYDSINFQKQPLYYKVVKVEAGQEAVTVEIENITSGKYAVSLYHDENGNNKLDTGSYGIPIEKYGFSNNAKPENGAPSFQDCMIYIDEGTEINITLCRKLIFN